MLYFSYGHDLNERSILEWFDQAGVRAPRFKSMTPAIARNYRLAFPVYSAYWQGGVAGLIAEPGKRVPGGLLDLSPQLLELLGEFHSVQTGLYRRAEVLVTPYARAGKPLRAATFVPAIPEDGHVPPTRLYVDRLVEAALELDLSAMWVMHLRSVATGPEETSQFFPCSASASRSRRSVARVTA
jgi:hypothetical protein